MVLTRVKGFTQNTKSSDISRQWKYMKVIGLLSWENLFENISGKSCVPNPERLKLKMDNNIMYVRATSETEEGFARLKTYFQHAESTVKAMWLLTESSEFSQRVQTPPLLVIPRKQIRTTVCCSSPGLTTKSLLKNRKEKASLGNRLFWALWLKHKCWWRAPGWACRTRDQQTFLSPGEVRTEPPQQRAPGAEPSQGLSGAFQQDGSRPTALHVKTHTSNFTGAKAACQEH